MRIHSVRLENYGPFVRLDPVRLGPMATIIGRNDVGKSHILLALQLFFAAKPRLEAHDVYDGASAADPVVIEVAFTDLPETITLDKSRTTLADEHLLDGDGLLRVRTWCQWAHGLDKFETALVVRDFADDRYAGLAALSGKKLDEVCKAVGVALPGPGTPASSLEKRQRVRDRAGSTGMTTRLLPLSGRDDLRKVVDALLPDFNLFATDTRLGVGETTFQSQFRPIVRDAVDTPAIAAVKHAFTRAIESALQAEVDSIFGYLERHTNAFAGLKATPIFAWDKAVTFDIEGEDQHGVTKSLDRRGSGLRRLLMVAYFQYLAEKSRGENLVLAVEEPENCLHPGLQRELAHSFRELARQGAQIIITSHSPVFAGASPVEDLVLVERSDGVARGIQPPDPARVAEELGIEPTDQIAGYTVCIFVEGPDDVMFLHTVAGRLKEAGYIDTTLAERRIGLLPAGGDNLKHWVNLRAISSLNRRFAVVTDSDRASRRHPIPAAKERRKRDCESQGGHCFILRKREIENYLHWHAIARYLAETGRPARRKAYDDFTDMKKAFGPKIIDAVQHMTCENFLEMDRYTDEDGAEHHELLELVLALLALTDRPVGADGASRGGARQGTQGTPTAGQKAGVRTRRKVATVGTASKTTD